MVSLIIVTLPVCAKALPQVIVTPEPIVMLVLARIFPTNVAPDKRLAEPVSTQYTPSVESAFIRLTTEPVSAVSELPTRKMKSTLLLFWASRVSFPFRSKVDPLE
jgi:hypothetical protein